MAAVASLVLATQSIGAAVAVPTEDPDVVEAAVLDVAPDGALLRVDLSTMSRAAGLDGAAPGTDQLVLDPADVVDQVPVAVTPAWSTPDGAGVDLRGAAGVDGPLRLDLTVENLTGEPTTVEVFDPVAGETVTATGTSYVPLTVTATMVLDQDHVVELRRGGSNAQFGRDADGRVVVQWAEVLAPPVRPAAARFTLDAVVADFEYVSFSVTVEPGAHAGFSLDRTVQQVFGGDLTPRAVNTYQTAADVRAELDAIRAELGVIQSVLTDRTLGRSAEVVAVLSGARDALQQQITGLGATLDASTGALAALTGARLGDAERSLRSGLGDLLDSLGYRLGEDGPVELVNPSPESILGLIDGVILTLDDPEGLQEGDSFVDQLLATIGDEGAACDVEEPSLRCQLETLGTDLDAVVDEALTELATTTVPDAVAVAEHGFGGAVDAVSAVRADLAVSTELLTGLAQRLTTGSVEVSMLEIAAALDALDDSLDTVEGDLGTVDEQLAQAAAALDGAAVRTAVDDVDTLVTELDAVLADLLAAHRVDIQDVASSICASADDIQSALRDANLLFTPKGKVDEEEPGTGDPGTGDPGTGDPGTGDPGTGDPGTGDPGTGDPGAGDPGAGDPGTGDDVVDDTPDEDAIDRRVRATVADVLAGVRALVDGGDCDGGGSVDGLLAQVDELIAATDGFDEVAAAVAALRDTLGQFDEVDEALTAARTSLGTPSPDRTGVFLELRVARDSVQAARDALAADGTGLTNDVADVAATIEGVVAALRDLGDGGGDTDPDQAVELLAAALEAGRIASVDLGDDLTDAVTDTRDALTTALARDVDGFTGELDDAVTGVRTLVESIAGQIDGDVTSRANGIATRSSRDTAATIDVLRGIVTDVEAGSDALRADVNATLAETRAALDRSIAAVFTNLTGSNQPRLNELGTGGFQGELRDQLEAIDGRVAQLGAAADETLGLGGLAHAELLGNAVDAALQRAGADRVGEVGGIGDGDRSLSSTVVFVFRFGALR